MRKILYEYKYYYTEVHIYVKYVEFKICYYGKKFPNIENLVVCKKKLKN